MYSQMVMVCVGAPLAAIIAHLEQLDESSRCGCESCNEATECYLFLWWDYDELLKLHRLEADGLPQDWRWHPPRFLSEVVYSGTA